MKKLTLLLLLILFKAYYSVSQTNDTVKILFIGNSFTAVNNLPLMFEQLAINAGKKVLVDQITFGGYTLQLHSQNTAVINKINERIWDYVVLQEQSQIPSFIPDRETLMYPYARKLDSIIHANSYCTKTVFFMTWAHKYGDLGLPPGSDTYEDMQQRLRSGYKEIADTLQAAISPCGWAWRKVIQENPNIELYSPDNYHPAENGTYLAACTFYAAIFAQSPLGLSFPVSINPSDAIVFQNAASEIVLDSLSLWNIGLYSTQVTANFDYSISANQVDFTNLSTKANLYFWDFGDGNTGNTPNISHTYLNGGFYNVRLVALNHCSIDTISKSISIITTALSSNSIDNEIKIYPNPAKDYISIELENNENIIWFNIFKDDIKHVIIEEKTEKIKLSIS